MNCQFSMNNEIIIRVKLYLCDIISTCVRHDNNLPFSYIYTTLVRTLFVLKLYFKNQRFSDR